MKRNSHTHHPLPEGWSNRLRVEDVSKSLIWVTRPMLQPSKSLIWLTAIAESMFTGLLQSKGNKIIYGTYLVMLYNLSRLNSCRPKEVSVRSARSEEAEIEEEEAPVA